ncbi:MAG: hypothetical protein U0469_02680 [Candidatus Paceibacterota bacterium]
MSRNIFSKIFSFYSLKLLFVVIVCLIFVFGAGKKQNKANAAININFYDTINKSNQIDFIKATTTNTTKENENIKIIQEEAKKAYIIDETNNLGDYIKGINDITANDASSTLLKKFLIQTITNGLTIAKNEYDNTFDVLRKGKDEYELGINRQIAIPNLANVTSKPNNGIDSTDDVSDTLHRAVRLYNYIQVTKFLNATSSLYTMMDPEIRKEAEGIQKFTHDGGNLNWSRAERALTDEEINSKTVYADRNGYGLSSNEKIDLNTIVKFTDITDDSVGSTLPDQPRGIQAEFNNKCQTKILWGVGTNNVIDNPNCSLAAYVVNGMFKLIASTIGIVLGWLGTLFNWIFDMSVLNFKDWVQNSHAVEIYKTIILAAIASLMLPLVFYLIIMMLIENDTKKIEKVLPKILFTALFIYFSFGIAGWLVDQSNIVTIYTYRAIHGGDTSQNFGDVISNTLGISAGDNQKTIDNIKYLGDWSTVAYTFGQICVNVLGLYVLFQAMILIFSRSIVLLLCLIFSPIMVLPDDLPGKFGDVLKKYKGMVMTNFINNLLLAPIFMFMMMIAIRIGNISGDLIKTNSELDAATVDNPGFLAGIIKTIVVVVVMQLAITVAKNLSGEVGGTISGAVSSFTGGVASGATKAFNRIRGNRQINTTSNTGSGNATENPWQNNNTQNRRPIPLQTAQSSVIAPTGQKPSIQNQNIANSFDTINAANREKFGDSLENKKRTKQEWRSSQIKMMTGKEPTKKPENLNINSYKPYKDRTQIESQEDKAKRKGVSVSEINSDEQKRIQRNLARSQAKIGNENNKSSKNNQKLKTVEIKNPITNGSDNLTTESINSTQNTNSSVSPISPNSSRNNQAREILKDKDVRQALKEGGFGKAFIGANPKKQKSMAETLKAITQERLKNRKRPSSKASDQLPLTNTKIRGLLK